MNPTVRIISKTFTLPTGEIRVVESHQAKTSRTRALFYVKIQSARWVDETQEAIYFLDPGPMQARMEERRMGVHGWFVGESGGGAHGAFVRARTAVAGRRGKTGGGTRMYMTSGGEHSFMDAK